MGSFLLMLIAGAGMVLASVWLALRLQRAGGPVSKTQYLRRAQDRLGGSLSWTGPLALETLHFQKDGVSSRIVLSQRPCPHQNRYMTHILINGVGQSSAEIHARTAGMSPGDAFRPKQRLDHDVTVSTTAEDVLVRTQRSDAGRAAVDAAEFRELLRELATCAGLAKFELALRDDEVCLALEGFVTSPPILEELHELLRRYGVRVTAAEPFSSQGEPSVPDARTSSART